MTMEDRMRAPIRCAAAAALLLAAGSAIARAADDSLPPPPQTPPVSATAPAPPADLPPATVLPKDVSQSILGKDVRSTADENMGRIVDVIVDKAGQARAAVIDFGGFLGVGSRKIAVDWAALHFAPDDKGKIALELTRDQVKAAPE